MQLSKETQIFLQGWLVCCIRVMTSDILPLLFWPGGHLILISLLTAMNWIWESSFSYPFYFFAQYFLLIMKGIFNNICAPINQHYILCVYYYAYKWSMYQYEYCMHFINKIQCVHILEKGKYCQTYNLIVKKMNICSWYTDDKSHLRAVVICIGSSCQNFQILNDADSVRERNTWKM